MLQGTEQGAQHGRIEQQSLGVQMGIAEQAIHALVACLGYAVPGNPRPRAVRVRCRPLSKALTQAMSAARRRAWTPGSA